MLFYYGLTVAYSHVYLRRHTFDFYIFKNLSMGMVTPFLYNKLEYHYVFGI